MSDKASGMTVARDQAVEEIMKVINRKVPKDSEFNEVFISIIKLAFGMGVNYSLDREHDDLKELLDKLKTE